MEYSHAQIQKIVKIEEYLNILRLEYGDVFEKSMLSFYNEDSERKKAENNKKEKSLPDYLTEKDKQKISEIHEKMQALNGEKTRKDIEFLNDRLRDLGYVKENGELNYASFYTKACIGQSVWSRYMNGQQDRTKQDTLLKIVLGLRLNEKDAKEYLSLAGSGFLMTDAMDCIILCYIRADYFGEKDMDDIINGVDTVLSCYREQDKKIHLLYNLL